MIRNLPQIVYAIIKASVLIDGPIYQSEQASR